ncbi:hypothetical protein HDE_05703 [Halotydeus destructor]|nr:hypothetical protein HDE_05703 [Halotydeus destructor]
MASNGVVLFVVLCTSGFVYQASEICWVYFRYPSSYSVSLTQPHELQVPSFTLCFSHNMSEATYTPWQVDFKMAPELSADCRIAIFNQDSADHVTNMNCSKFGHYGRYIVNGYWCLNYMTYTTLWTRRSIATVDKIFIISLTKPDGLAYFRTHQNGRHVNTKLNHFEVKTALRTYHFHWVSISRLSAPYQGNCFNYLTQGFVSVDDCLDHCVTNLSIDYDNKWPQGVAAPSDVELTVSENSSNRYVIECERKCSRDDCHQIQHGGDVSNGISRDFVSFRVVASPDFDVESTEVAKFHFIELVCYVASLGSLWFGSSVLTVGRTVLSKSSKRKGKQRARCHAVRKVR